MEKTQKTTCFPKESVV